MTENKVSKTTEEAQEPLKKEKTYKVTCETFEARNEALQRAAEARREGAHVSLTICKTEYNLFYAEGMTKAEVEAAKKGNRGEKGKCRGFRAVKKM